MSHESSSATGICPYPDCGATITPGKRFCKACGRPVQSAPAAPSSPPVPKESVAPIQEPVATSWTQSANEPVERQDLQADTGPPNSVSTGESISSPDVAVAPPSQIRRQADRPAVSQRLLVTAGIVVIAVLTVSGYWFMRPKTGQLAAIRTQGPVNPPPSASIQSAIPASQTPPPPAPKETRDVQLPQQDDALRRERERLTLERVKLEQVQQEAREQEQRRQQELAQRQQEAEAQQRALAELKTKQEEQQRQIDEERRKLADEQAQREREAQARRVNIPTAPAPISQPAPTYRGPSSGEIVWEGIIKGTELITIENGQSSSGTLTGALPGVAILIQPTDTKKVSIASTPGPRNQFNRLVFRVSGNGNTRVTLKWSLP